jgi:hypothetical protein
MLDNIIDILGFASVKDVLQVVLVPSTLALLASFFARRWQESERELEIKTQLVSEISELVMTTTMTIYLFHLNSARKEQDDSSLEDELHRIYKEWRIENCVLGSKLHAYFPNPIHDQWKLFSGRLTTWYEAGMDKVNQSTEQDRESLYKEKESIIKEILHSRVKWNPSKQHRQQLPSDGRPLGSTSIYQ